MVPWILAVLALFVVQTLLPNAFRFFRLSRARLTPELVKALGPRDEMPPLGAIGERAGRALENLKEALPVFLTIALLNVIRPVTDGTAELGASVFVAARTVYVPTYIFGVFGLRSLFWLASWVGLAMMIADVV